MIIYLLVFLISVLLLYLSERIRNVYLRKGIIILAILLPSILAGCRASTIGTDVEVYGINNFNRARNIHSFFEYFNYYRNATLAEPLYHFLIYVISRIASDFHWSLFGIELIIIIFAYLAVKRCNRVFGTPVWLAMLLYYLSLYNVSLNLMRQTIAISVLFLAVTYLFEENYIKYFFFLLISVGFHVSAIVGIVFLFVYLILREGRKVEISKQIFQVVVMLLTGIGGVMVGKTVVIWLVEEGYLRRNYLNYLGGEGAYTSNYISWGAISLYVVYSVVLLIHYKYMKNKRKEWLFFTVMTLVFLASKFGSLVSVFLSRIGLYCLPLVVVGLANVSFSYGKKTRRYWNAIMILYVLFVWYITFVYWGSNETVPYVSDIFG